MTAREVAWHVLDRVMHEGRLITDCYPFIFDHVKDDRDRRLVVEIVYGVCRFQGRLEFVLSRYANRKRTEEAIWILLMAAAYQVLFLTRTPDYAIINETVTIAKKLLKDNPKKSGFVNAVLKRLAKEKDTINFPSQTNLKCFIEQNLSFPYWMGMKWISDYGQEKAIGIMKSLNFRKPVVFRCFRGVESFDSETIFHKTPFLENSVEAKVPIYLMRAGSCYVMNESSQLVPELLANFEGELVLDAASSPGGKGFILSSFPGIKRVLFNDISPQRIARILENSKDLYITIEPPVCSDLVRPAFRTDTFNAILLDAPCTGTGTISGHPELKWIRKPGEIGGRSKLQRRLIRNAYSLLKPGGVLVYSVCSLEKEEGEDVVLDFVANETSSRFLHPFTFAKPAVTEKFQPFLRGEKFLRILPNKYLDGFFAALIQKER